MKYISLSAFVFAHYRKSLPGWGWLGYRGPLTRWVDTSKFTYLNLKETITGPIPEGQCLEMAYTGSGKWEEEACTTSAGRYAVCKIGKFVIVYTTYNHLYEKEIFNGCIFIIFILDYLTFFSGTVQKYRQTCRGVTTKLHVQSGANCIHY